MLDPFNNFDAIWNRVAVNFDVVVGEGAGDFDVLFLFDGDSIEKFVAVGIPELAVVFENDKAARIHAASGPSGGLVELEGIFEGGEEEFEVVVGEASLVGEEGVYEALRFVEAVGNGEFSAHGALFLDVFFVGDRRAGNGVLAGNDGVDQAGE